MVKVGNYQIPFDENGNQLHYAYYHANMRDNVPFEDTLTFKGFERGRSAAYFQFLREDSTAVCMFMTDLSVAMPHIVNGKITGTFQFIKRGANFGCRLVAPA